MWIEGKRKGQEGRIDRYIMFEMPDITIISRCHNITGTYGNGYCLYVMHTCVAELEKRVCAFRHCTLSATSVGLYLFFYALWQELYLCK